jgi:hypothetical protein
MRSLLKIGKLHRAIQDLLPGCRAAIAAIALMWATTSRKGQLLWAKRRIYDMGSLYG